MRDTINLKLQLRGSLAQVVNSELTAPNETRAWREWFLREEAKDLSAFSPQRHDY